MEIKMTVISFLSLFHVFNEASAINVECSADKYTPINLSLCSRRNTTGDWVTSFSLDRDDSSVDSANHVTLDLSQVVTECGGKRKVHIRGVLSGNSAANSGSQRNTPRNDLLFHIKSGTNVAVINDGRTARKINLESADYAVVFTHRPLEMNELLEVKLEKQHSKFSYSLGIGVTTLSPIDSPQLMHINSITNGSWAMYHGNTYLNGKELTMNYGKNINTLELGGRVGVMRSSTGSLNFFVNGEDQGPAASNVPFPVYGIVELWGNAGQVTIAKS